MKNKNLLIVLCAVALVAAVAVLAAVLPQQRTISADAPALNVTEAPAATAVPEPTEAPEVTAAPEPTAAHEASEAPAETQSAGEATVQAPEVSAYLVITAGGMIYEPLPLAGEGSFRLTMDENTSNTVHVTPDSVWMEHSTCDNQDCVEQGVVSLENMNTRVLANMIICLPNEVVLELHTPETLKETFGIEY